MRAYQVVDHDKPLECRTIMKPFPGDHEVLARTTYSGVCHTDVHVVNGDWGPVKLPLTPGHEGVGVVEAVGPHVTSMKVGDRIGIPWLGTACTECYLCKDGRSNLCEKQKQTGFINNGSFAEYFIADERFAVKIPENIPDAKAAPVLCAGVTSYKALRMAQVQPGARIVISGACGGLGHMGIQYAKCMGLEVVALDMFDEAKTEMMKSLGADFTVNLVDTEKDVPLYKRIEALTPSKPIEASIIFAPALRAVSDAVDYCSPGATIVAVALPCGEFKINVLTFILKELRLQGSIVGTPADLVEAFRYVSEGKVDAHVEEKPFEAVNEILDDLEKGKIKGRLVLKIAQ